MLRMKRLGSMLEVALDNATRWAAVLGGVGIFVMMLAMVADAVGRKVIGPVPGAFETANGLLVLVLLAPQAYAQICGSHVGVDILSSRMSPKIQVIIVLLAAILGSLIFVLLTWLGLEKAWHSTVVNETWFGIVEYPVWPCRWFIPLGTGLLTLQLVRSAINALGQVMRGS